VEHHHRRKQQQYKEERAGKNQSLISINRARNTAAVLALIWSAPGRRYRAMLPQLARLSPTRPPLLHRNSPTLSLPHQRRRVSTRRA
jgi:hypothetical protein